MRFNELKPAAGAKRKSHRVGRGIGSGDGKTCGRGHKGQKSRTGSRRRAGFEGGQMPLQRRLPKFGFPSAAAKFGDEIRLGELAKVDNEIIDVAALHAAGLIRHNVKQAKVIASGSIDRAVTVRGLKVTPGALKAIEAAGGKVEA